MSWLISLIVAGVMLAHDGNLPATGSYNFTESESRVEQNGNLDETERFEQTYPLSANGTVSVSNINGSITVETWERSEVKLEYVKTSDDREALADIVVKIDAKPESLSVETDQGRAVRNLKSYGGSRKNYYRSDVDYHLIVPRNAILDKIETVNGSVAIANSANLTKASAVNGKVKATNLRGTANLSAVNGTVDADFDQLAAGSRISLNTVNGTVNLVIPSDASATVKADTLNGEIINDFGLPVRKGEYVGRNLYGKIGGGDVQIRLNSVNGALSVKRKNDGKNLNSATNLLTTKTENDWDDNEEDADAPAGVSAPRPPRPPRAPRAPRAPRNPVIDNEEINQTIKESLKAAQKEIDNIKPELDKIAAEGLKQAADIDTKELNAQIKQAQAKYRQAMAEMSNINWTIGAPSIEEKSESFPVKGTPNVTVDARNCQVSVRGWDKPEVRYSTIRISRGNQKKPTDTESAISVKASDSDVNIKVSAESFAPGAAFDEATKMRIEVFVPKKSNLKVVTNREIRLEGVSGAIDLQGADESINIRDAGGKLSAATSDGKIRVIGFKGAIDTRTTDGAIDLEGDFHGLSARTTDGTIVLTLPENINANIESNRKKDIVGEGFSLIYQADGKSTSTWKIGSGGENYLLYTYADGRVIVRSAKQLQN